MSASTLAYAGGELPETNVGLMPGLARPTPGPEVEGPAGRQGADRASPTRASSSYLARQAGGVASRSKPIVAPEDAKGLKVRGGSRETWCCRPPARPLSVPSTALCGDADRRLRCRHHLLHQPDLVPPGGSREIPDLGRRRLLLVVLEPLLMSKAIFDNTSETSRTSS